MNRMKNLYHKITAVASTATMLALPSLASAQSGLEQAQTSLGAVGSAGGFGAADENALPALIGRGINAILSVLGIVLVVYLVWAGFIWMTAAGDPKKVETATSMIKQAVIGIIIVIAAYAIASFVIGTLVSTVSGT